MIWEIVLSYDYGQINCRTGLLASLIQSKQINLSTSIIVEVLILSESPPNRVMQMLLKGMKLRSQSN